jgi:hypothetical protein
MPWLVGLIDCRGGAEGDLAIFALPIISIHRDQGYGKRIGQGNRGGKESPTGHLVLINSTSLEPVTITAGSRILPYSRKHARHRILLVPCEKTPQRAFDAPME